MNIIRLSFAILSLASITRGATNEAFEITSYFPDTGNVWINNGAGKTNRSFSSFSAAEQQQITGWLADREFLSKLDVNIEKEIKVRGTKFGDITDTFYTITLENRAAINLENMEMVCQIFYETKDDTRSGVENAGSKEQKRSKIEKWTVFLQANSARTYCTTIVPIRNERIVLNISSGTTMGVPTGKSTHFNMTDRLIGMYLCVSKKDRNGQIIKMEFANGSIPKEDERKDYLEKAPANDDIKNFYKMSQEAREKVNNHPADKPRPSF